MRTNHENKSMDMEQRDINYILPAYVRSYLFHSKNEMPEKIIFPMFASVKVNNIDVPIEYVPPLGEIAVEIAKDGSSVAEVTPAQEAALDEKDEEIKKLKADMAELRAGSRIELPLEDEIRQGKETVQQLEDDTADKQLEVDTAPKVSPAKAAFAASLDRKPNQPPGGDIGPGLGLSDMHSRDRRDQARTAKDLKEEPDIDEAAEKEYEKGVSRGEDGKPVVEEK